MLTLKVYDNGFCFVLNGKDMSVQEIKQQGYIVSVIEKTILLNTYRDMKVNDNYDDSFSRMLDRLCNISMRDVLDYNIHLTDDHVRNLTILLCKGCQSQTKKNVHITKKKYLHHNF